MLVLHDARGTPADSCRRRQQGRLLLSPSAAGALRGTGRPFIPHQELRRARPLPDLQMTGSQRATLVAVTLGLGITILDETVVFLALPAINRDLAVGFSGQQWVVNGYLLPLAALLLVAGSLADRYGRRRTFVLGLAGFGLASAAAGLAPTAGVLITARVVQGVFAALLMPSTLALLTAGFRGAARSAAIGSWAAWSGIAAAIGPLVAGVLIATTSWRAVFFLSLPVVGAALALAPRIPESRGTRSGPLDLLGAGLAALVVAAGAYALVQGPALGWTDPRVLATAGATPLALAAFLAHEVRTRSPMLPLRLFRSRALRAANIATLTLYAVFNGAFFLVTIYLQTVLGYSPLAAGAATLPMTLLMIALSSRVGRWAATVGARGPMVAGQTLAAGGVGWLSFVQPGDGYASAVLPGVLLFGTGLALTVAPLTDTAVSSAADDDAGIASGVNNAVARLAALVGVAVLGVVFALAFQGNLHGTGSQLEQAASRPSSAPELELTPAARDQVNQATSVGYATAMRLAGALALLGAGLSLAGIPGRTRPPRCTDPDDTDPSPVQ